MPQLTSDPTDILIAHDAWATRRLLILCRSLSREQFHQPFNLGLKTLHHTLTHVVGVMRRWTDRIAERPVRPMLDAVPGAPSAVGADVKDRTPDELLAILDDAERDLKAVLASLRPDGLAGILRLEFPDDAGRMRRHTFTKGAALIHLCTHSMHHRAQAIAMLKMLNLPGISDAIPETDAMEWQTDTESPAEYV